MKQYLMQKEKTMNIYDLYHYIIDLENENNPENNNIIEALYNLIAITTDSADGLISEKNFDKTCDNFRQDFPNYQFPNCIYFKGDSNE